MDFRLVSAVGLVLLLTFGCVSDARPGTKFHLSMVDTQKAAQMVRQPSLKQKLQQQTKVPAWEPQSTQMVGPQTWNYPVSAEPEAKSAIELDQQNEPIPADTVTAECGERVVRVEVKQDFLGIGQPIQPDHLTLGGCAAIGEDASEQTIVFEAELNACGSQLMMTEEALIYTFTLIYESEPLGETPIVKTSNAMVGIECHYLRNQNVSSNTLNPTWTPFAANKVSDGLLYFSLTLMTDDWRFERPINQYFLGDLINIEASLIQYYHVPMRVFVDSCFATLVPNDVNAVPRYDFIDNFGCLVDATHTGSSSHFLPRTQDDKLQFQLESFMFPEQSSDTIYITCHLRASPAAYTQENSKACSYIDRWRSADGNDAACGCCETSSCTMVMARDVTTGGGDSVWEGVVSLGAIKVL